MPKANPPNPKLPKDRRVIKKPDDPPTLDSLGINKNLAKSARVATSVPAEKFAKRDNVTDTKLPTIVGKNANTDNRSPQSLPNERGDINPTLSAFGEACNVRNP